MRINYIQPWDISSASTQSLFPQKAVLGSCFFVRCDAIESFCQFRCIRAEPFVAEHPSCVSREFTHWGLVSSVDLGRTAGGPTSVTETM